MAVADFETITRPDDCRVWAWAVAQVAKEPDTAYGTDIHSFLTYVATAPKRLYWFHNLAFDGKFIVDALFRLGYEWTHDKPGAGEFSTLVSSKGKFYQLEIGFYNGTTIKFQDSLKVFPMSVKKLAKAFSLPEEKGELDYGEWREVGHALTDEEEDYIRRDVEIVACALGINAEQGLTKMTIGSNAFGFFKRQMGTKVFEHYFPLLTPDEDADVRRSYRGGFTYVNPRYAGVDVYGGISVDYNSMYPSMLISKWYPVGAAHMFYGRYHSRFAGDCATESGPVPAWDETRDVYVQTLTCSFELKPDCVPMVQLRNSGFYGEHEYVRKTVEPVQLTLTCVDLKLLFDNYDVDVWSWDGGYWFVTAPGSELFGPYVEHWGKIKRESKGPMRQLAKLMLNNIYGKFATNPDVTGKRPVMGEDGCVKWVLGEHEERDGVYIPVGTFTTAYARDTLIRAIHANWDRFIYCDTDSMHLEGYADPADIPLHDTNLCAWKVEGRFGHARHLRAKCYIWDLNGEVSVTCAGMPDNVKALCTFDNFHYGLSNVDPVTGEVIEGAGKLTPVAVPGGVVLEARKYVLHE